jgi:hypothetical protein
MQAVMSTNGLKRQLEDWSQINWRKVNKLVKNLRQRIFRARKRGFLQDSTESTEVNATKLRKLIIICSTYHSDQ